MGYLRFSLQNKLSEHACEAHKTRKRANSTQQLQVSLGCS
jgi:hypothetical protein